MPPMPPDAGQRETRSGGAAAMTNAEGEQMRVTGHAAVFNVVADLGYFREQIAPGAFAAAIADDDVRALIDHDARLLIGRNRSGTLKLSEDTVGLAVDIALPGTQYARDLAEVMRRGDMTQMSFGFATLDEVWEKKDGVPLRTIKRAKLFDVSVVAFPAYPQTDAVLRSLAPTSRARLEALAAPPVHQRRRLRLALAQRS